MRHVIYLRLCSMADEMDGVDSRKGRRQQVAWGHQHSTEVLPAVEDEWIATRLGNAPSCNPLQLLCAHPPWPGYVSSKLIRCKDMSIDKGSRCSV